MCATAWTPAEVGRKCRTSPGTVRQWITAGVRLPDGTRVRLQAERVGNRWLVTSAALKAFKARCTAAALPPKDGNEAAGCPMPDKRVQQRLDACQKRLKARGL